ncbi:amino acid adenylation domain-containing protein [Micromonospora peucetia]|uniref:amino acid adenylation domain-containing protein n=1 Tax=Micromonospora peucetia TaxID=47871 RepID=UPI003321084C
MVVESWADDACLDGIFRKQVELTPQGTAVVDSSTALTYVEIFSRAVALARELTARGVERESLVGVLAPRSADTVVAFLGIVLAGGAYVPLDPADPPERLARVLSSAGVRIALAPTARRIDGVEMLALDDLAVTAEDPWSYRSPAVPAGHSPLAYVMFTSGSTGTPKGVMVEHAGIVRLVRGTDYLDFTQARRILHAAALRFDAATFEIWGALLNGGTVCVVDDETAVVPSRLGVALRDHEVDTCWLTAPLFHQVTDEDPGVLATVRTVLTGGDVVSPVHVRRARRANPGLRIINGYGPTENTTFTTTHLIDRDPEGAIPIGRPIAGTTVMICGPDGAPVPNGEIGELYTGGRGVARGYLNLPELTAERFVRRGGERYYRTGDLVHRDAGGVLHFHGRRDNQVKIRGNLVVTDEVNGAVLELAGVLDSYTRALDGPAGRRYMVSWVVAPGRTAATVRSELRARLPGYMCPEHVALVDRLPLSSSGKVDWRALPAPDPAADRHDGADLPLELVPLAEIWAQVLNLPQRAIGPTQQFADLGGDSLRLGLVLGRIQQRYGVRVPLAEVGTAVTLDALRKAIESTDGGGAGAEPIPAVGGAAVPLHPNQQSLYALWRTDPDSVAYNIPFRLDLRGPLDRQRLQAAFAEVVARHDALHMRFELAGAAAPDAVRQQPVDDARPEFVYRQDGPSPSPAEFTRPFDPDRPVVPRACLVRLAPDRHELHVDIHHLVFDGVSLRVFVAELLDHYGGTPRRAAAVRYADAANWAHERLHDGAQQADEQYWRERLGTPLPPLALATDHPRGPVRAGRGAVVRREHGRDWLDRLNRRARELDSTEFAVVAAAYAAALHRMTGQAGFGIGAPVTGRTRPDLEDVVGMFVSTVCLDVRIDPDMRLADLVAQLDGRIRGALDHQELPFPRVVELTGASAEAGRNPLFEAFIALQNIDFYEFRRGDLDVSVDVLNPGTTRFDLNLQIYRRPDRVVLDLEYATDLFERRSAEHILDVYEAVATELLNDPTRAVRPAAAASARSMSDFDF